LISYIHSYFINYLIKLKDEYIDKNMKDEASYYTEKEEFVNYSTSLIGLSISVVGFIFLIIFSYNYGEMIHLLCCTAYGLSMVFMYVCSTFYHGSKSGKLKKFFRLMDHSSIFLYIAGSYTPFTLINLKGVWGWSIFSIVWFLAITGIILRIIFRTRAATITMVLYILMGWTIIVAIKPLIDNLALNAIILLFTGGISYTAGLIFYSWNSLPYHHAIWHIFVMIGSFTHFFAVLFYVIPIF